MSSIRGVIGGERRTLLALVMGLVFVEAAFRLAGDRLSGDVAHMEEMGEIAREVANSDGLGLLFVGNSLIGEGLDSERLESILSDSLGQSVRVGTIRPDGTSPLEWYYLTDRHVFDPAARPDMLLIPFGPGHLFDRPGNEAVLRLAAHHVAFDQLGEVLTRDIQGFDAAAQFTLARLSRAYALRDRVQPRVLDQIIPDYQSLAPLILRSPRQAHDGNAIRGQRDTRLLERLLARAERESVPVVFIAMPSGPTWTIDKGISRLISDHALALLELNAQLRLPPERFPDGQHLDERGRQMFTDALATEMLPLLARLSR